MDLIANTDILDPHTESEELMWALVRSTDGLHFSIDASPAKIVLLSIWRPEAEAEAGDPDQPFDGIETYLVGNEHAAMALANMLADQHETWKFHISTATPWEANVVR